MTIYYLKQDYTVWCCEEDSGPYQEQIEETFVKCECESVWAGKEADIAAHLQEHAGGGEVLQWRVANGTELAAWYSGGDDAFQEGVAFAENRIIKLLEALATHKDCQLGEHHEDYVWNSPLGIIEVLTKWDGKPIALIKGEQK